MPRPAKPADYTAICRLHNAAGSREELNRWIDLALSEKGPPRGRKAYKERFRIGDLERIFKAKGARRAELIRQFLRDHPEYKGIGFNSKSAFQRLDNKLRKSQAALEKMVTALRDGLSIPLPSADSIRARIKSHQAVKRREYKRPLVKQTDGRFHDASRNRAPSPAK